MHSLALTGESLHARLASEFGQNSDAQLGEPFGGESNYRANYRGWVLAVDAQSLRKEITFKSFRAAIGFIVEISIAADSMQHHPEWSNSYKTVAITLTTHSAGGLTELDFKLAHLIDRAVSSRSHTVP